VEALGGAGGFVFGDHLVEELVIDGEVFGGKAFDLAVEA
jgi:hypothetical protein